MKVCLFTGNCNAFNVRLTTKNIYNALDAALEVDVVTTAPKLYSENKISTYGEGQADTLRGAARGLYSYLGKNSPAVIMNITNPPIHGNIIGLLSNVKDSTYIYRYSGDRFCGYKIKPAAKKPYFYCLNNIVGRIPLYLADGHIALGPTGERRLQSRGVNSESVEILPPLFDGSRYDDKGVAEIENLNTDHPIALFVGRVSKSKGVDTLFEAIPEIVSHHESMRFVLVGPIQEDIPIPDEYEDHVVKIGAVEPNQVIKYYNLADVLIHPSRTEGLPRVLVESLFCGTPVVARKAGDMPYVTQNIFSSVEGLVKLIEDYKNLPLDDPHRFSIDSLREKYITYFGKMAER